MGSIDAKDIGSPLGPLVIEYHPKEFGTQISTEAKSFITQQHEKGSGFKINPLMAEKAGVSRLQAETLERAIEAQALSRLKDIQEKAYQEAFDLGMQDGAKRAFEQKQEEFIARLSDLDSFLREVEALRSRLVTENESQIVALAFHIGKCLALKEIKEDPTAVIDLIRGIMEEVQTEERILIRISPDDLQFVQDLKGKTAREDERFAKVKIEGDPKIKSGGCILETNFGSIDATIEQRVNKAWDIVKAKIPKVEEKRESGDSQGE